MRPLLLLLVLLVSSPAWAVEAKIVGPDKANPGDLVVLSGTDSVDATDYEWQLVQSDKTFLAVDDGQRVVFATGQQGTYCFILAVAGEEDGKPAVSIAVHCVTVGKPGPGPDPGPDPDPDPDLTGLAKACYDRAKRIDDPETTGEIAENFGAIVSAIGAGAYDKRPLDEAKLKIIGDLYSLNDPVTEGKTAWKEFSEFLRGELNKLERGGKFGSLADVGKTLTEVQTGLAEAAK